MLGALRPRRRPSRRRQRLDLPLLHLIGQGGDPLGGGQGQRHPYPLAADGPARKGDARRGDKGAHVIRPLLLPRLIADLGNKRAGGPQVTQHRRHHRVEDRALAAGQRPRVAHQLPLAQHPVDSLVAVPLAQLSEVGRLFPAALDEEKALVGPGVIAGPGAVLHALSLPEA